MRNDVVVRVMLLSFEAWAVSFTSPCLTSLTVAYLGSIVLWTPFGLICFRIRPVALQHGHMRGPILASPFARSQIPKGSLVYVHTFFALVSVD